MHPVMNLHCCNATKWYGPQQAVQEHRPSVVLWTIAKERCTSFFGDRDGLTDATTQQPTLQHAWPARLFKKRP